MDIPSRSILCRKRGRSVLHKSYLYYLISRHHGSLDVFFLYDHSSEAIQGGKR